jgi:hypothetical protein
MIYPTLCHAVILLLVLMALVLPTSSVTQPPTHQTLAAASTINSSTRLLTGAEITYHYKGIVDTSLFCQK